MVARVIWLALLLSACSNSSSTGAGGDSVTVFEADKFAQAYALLEEKDRANVRQRIHAVRIGDVSGVSHANGRGVITLSRDHLRASVQWLASVLVHEAWHVAQGHYGCLNEQERPAIAEQLRVLRYTGAMPWEINYLENQITEHCI